MRLLPARTGQLQPQPGLRPLPADRYPTAGPGRRSTPTRTLASCLAVPNSESTAMPRNACSTCATTGAAGGQGRAVLHASRPTAAANRAEFVGPELASARRAARRIGTDDIGLHGPGHGRTGERYPARTGLNEDNGSLIPDPQIVEDKPLGQEVWEFLNSTRTEDLQRIAIRRAIGRGWPLTGSRRSRALSAILQGRHCAQIASLSCSPVRIRTILTSVTKILPSPILPVRAALVMASIRASTWSSAITTSIFQLRQEVDDVSAPRYNSLCLLAPKPLFDRRHAGDARCSTGSTSSSLNGLIIARFSSSKLPDQCSSVMAPKRVILVRTINDAVVHISAAWS